MSSSLLTTTTLIGFRLLPIFVVAPVASFRRAPKLVRVVITVALASILATGAGPVTLSAPEGVFWTLLVSEFVVGASLASSFHAASASVHMMGQLIDTQIGFAAGTLFDPTTEQVASPTAELMTLSLLIVLMALNVHYDLILGFSKVIQTLPPGTNVIWSDQWISIIGIQFTMGFIVFSPIVLTLWLLDVAIAYISRSLPQAQIYFVGLPVKIGIGILTIAWFTNHLLTPFHRLLTQALYTWNLMFTS